MTDVENGEMINIDENDKIETVDFFYIGGGSRHQQGQGGWASEGEEGCGQD